jgi:hypothetical protein
MRSEHSDEQSAEQLQEVDHPEERIPYRDICASADVIFGSHRCSFLDEISRERRPTVAYFEGGLFSSGVLADHLAGR